MDNKNKPYENLQLGFDRTQIYKEYTHPHYVRMNAVEAVSKFCQLNQLRLTIKETMALVNKYVKFIETGDTSWAEKVDEYMMKKFEED